MNRGELYTSVLSSLNRDDEPPERLDEWLVSATFRINQLLRANEQVIPATLPVTETLFPVPDNFLEYKSLSILSGVSTDTATAQLTGNTLGELQFFPAVDVDGGRLPTFYPNNRPRWFTQRGRFIELGPWVGDTAYTVRLWYYAELPVLREATDTNWLLSKAFHIYKNAMLHFGHNHYLEFDTASGYMGSVMAECQQMNENAKMAQYGAGPLIMAPARKLGGRRS